MTIDLRCGDALALLRANPPFTHSTHHYGDDRCDD